LKILCVSDQIDPIVYTPSIKERFGDVDLILSAGDLPLEYLDFIISTLNKPSFFVFGNHHTEELKYYKRLWDSPFTMNYGEYRGCGAVHLGSNVVSSGKFILAGLGGSMRYNNGANQFTDFEMYIEIIKLFPKLFWNRIFHGRYLDILLTHAPPKGIHDKSDKCHWGFKSYLWFMKVFKPKYLIHGHIHLYDLSEVRLTKWENTTIINAYSHYVINTGE
jgi:Icc-related predicted phosphoesterase